MQIFARITKVDEATGKVYGRAVQEVVDRSGEIFDYETSKPLFMKWSEAAAQATDGRSVGNLRAMHGKVAAGKLTEINFLDVEKAIDIVTEVVDPVEREKCVKGVYTGFSIGGRYAKKWEDGVQKGVSRYTAEPNEISLVDLPCVPTAQFTVVKADGSEELRKFETTTDNSDALAKWAEGLTDGERDAILAKIAKRPGTDPKDGEDKYGNVKYADPKNKKYPLDTEKHIRAAWSYIHMPKNAAKYDAEDLKTIKAAIVSAWKDVIGGEPDEAEKLLASQAERLAKHASAAPIAAAISVLIGHEPQLEKGLWAVSQFACLLEQLACMADGIDWEEEHEGDDSSLPMQFRAALKPLAQAFMAMAAEEVDEALHGQLNDDAALALAAQGEMRKALGCADGDDALAKAAGLVEQLAKAEGELAASHEALEKATKERDETLAKMQELTKQYTHWLTQPAPAKGSVRAVEKSVGVQEEAHPEPNTEPVMKADGSIDHVATAHKLAKASYAQPRIGH